MSRRPSQGPAWRVEAPGGASCGELGVPRKLRRDHHTCEPLWALSPPKRPPVQPSWPLQADLDLHRCCHAHDCCYGRLEKLGCEPKMERYLFSATRHSIFCGE